MDDITKTDLVFLGGLYFLQPITTFFYPYISAFNENLAIILTGITKWPGMADLSTFGTYFIIIIGFFAVASGIGLIMEKGWAWGSGIVSFCFIILMSGIAFVTDLINSFKPDTDLSVSSVINLLMVIIAILGLMVERPWSRKEGLDQKIWVASISHYEVNSEKLAEHLHVKNIVLVDRITELIAKIKLTGLIRYPSLTPSDKVYL